MIICTLNKLKCLCGLHSWKNTQYVAFEDGIDKQFPSIIGTYLFKCKHCNKQKTRQFAFPHGSGTKWTRKDARSSAKSFSKTR